MKINYSFIYTIPIILVLFMDNMFIELIAPGNTDFQGMIRNKLLEGLSVFSIVYCGYYFRRMSRPMQIAYGLTTTYVLALVFESMYKYNTFMVYPHVFLKVFLFYFVFFIYTFYKGSYYINFSHIAYFILIGFWMNVILINPDALSIASFSNHERGVHSTSVFLLLIPFLYFLSRYFEEGKLISLFWTFFVFISLFFFQHRTVWIATAVALAVYYPLLKFKSEKNINVTARLMPVFFLVTVVGIASSAFLFSTHPEIIAKVQEDIADINNFEGQGTGAWRYMQWLSYLPFIEDNLIFGMRFEGFELPIQFYRDDIDKPVFEDGFGHFFHSFYVDVLFYIGLLGLFLFFIVIFYLTRKTLTAQKLNWKHISLFAFVCSGLVYGISYVLPPFFYGIVGWAVVTIEEETSKPTNYLLDFAKRFRAKRVAAHTQYL